MSTRNIFEPIRKSQHWADTKKSQHSFIVFYVVCESIEADSNDITYWINADAGINWSSEATEVSESNSCSAFMYRRFLISSFGLFTESNSRSAFMNRRFLISSFGLFTSRLWARHIRLTIQSCFRKCRRVAKGFGCSQTPTDWDITRRQQFPFTPKPSS